MRVSSIEISNIKSFEDSGVINLDKRMNILIGPNNAGKSVIIKALYFLQDIQALSVEDIRRGESEGKIVIGLEDIDVVQYQQIYHATEGFLSKVHITISSSSNKPNKDMLVINQDGASVGTGALSQSEPNNYIYPFLAKRKVMIYDTSVNLDSQNAVPENLHLLTAKINRIADQHYELNKTYEAACKDIIGFSLSTVAIPSGQIVGLPIGKYGSIPITAMGEGIPHLLGLINDLCLAENKLFLIEEPENDIHPKALKHLLDLIIQKSDSNQFVISTHSHIVMQHLGSIENSKIHYINRDETKPIPTALYREIGTDPEERRAVLEELGYEMTDYGLWSSWLILEESSAERIINDFLIPQFAPKLKGRLRTIAAHCVDNVPIKFEDFNKLFLFTHRASMYKNKAWVVVDNGNRGNEIIEKLKEKYVPGGWKEEQFRLFSKEDFEEYYPEDFQDEVTRILQKPDGQHKQEEKRKLLNSVLEYIKKDEQTAREAFGKSAREVIKLLQEIEKVL
jgi:hypothetical protein